MKRWQIFVPEPSIFQWFETENMSILLAGCEGGIKTVVAPVLIVDCQVLAEALKENRTLKHLNLAENCIGIGASSDELTLGDLLSHYQRKMLHGLHVWS